MNTISGIRASAGLNAPTNAQRHNVAEKLASQGTPKYPKAVTDLLKSLSVQKQDEGGSQTDLTSGLDQELSRDAFLQLLVTQLQNQDPLDPVDNSEMLAQLAQFSSLEQMNNLNESFEQLSGNMDQLNFISASGLVGRDVTGVNAEGLLVSGEVEGVHLDGSVVTLTVDGQILSMAGIVRIGDPASDGDGGK